MKTIEKKYYVCEICGKTAQNPEKVRECQESHKDVSAADVTAAYRKGKVYPKSILFSFEDGSSAEYVYNYSADKSGKTSTNDA